MRKRIYRALRSEATQAITSVRQLAIGENAAFAIILVELLKTKSLYELLALDSVLIGLVYFATRLGRDWFIQGYRQLSYIFVAYELHERNRMNRSPNAHSFNLWTLANRSGSFLAGGLQQHGVVSLDPTPRKPFRTHTPGRELRTFLMHQFLLLVIAVVATTLAALRALSPLIPQLGVKVSTEHLHQLYIGLLLNSLLITLDIVVSILLVIYLRKLIGQADEALDRLTLNWLKYFSARDFWDNSYLIAKGFDVQRGARDVSTDFDS